jgi:hypothetical protein
MKVPLVPVVVFVVIFIVVFVAVAITVTVAMAWCLELAFFAQVAVTGQYLPFIGSAGFQPSQLQGVVRPTARMISGAPRLVAAGNAIADMVGSG